VSRVVPSGDHCADLKKLRAGWSVDAVDATQRGVLGDGSCHDIVQVVVDHAC